jgi:prepilin-type N-terminal cleavage/methylation domain-containing protein
MKKLNKGYTLIEMLVVIVIFATVALVASETLILTLRGTRKANAVSKVRQDVDYALGSMERQLRGAKLITSACTGAASSQISFTDQNGNNVTFSCINVNNSNLPASIASSSGTLTSSNITISACSFTCTPGNGSSPTQVTMNINAKDLAGQNAPVSATTQVTLRSY